jgi:hypothetical protein
MLELYENKEWFDKLSKGACTYNALYGYWREQLFERVMRLFVWESDVEQKEIEQRLIIAGHCGITKLPRKKDLTAMFGTFYGVTEYFDEFKNYTVHCPIYAGTRTIGKDVAIISNNAERNPVLPLIHHYAQLLAHAEVTFLNILINARDNSGIPIVSTERQKQAVLQYQGKKFNGQYSAIADPGALGVNYTQQTTLNSSLYKEMWETRNNILKEFYSDIGVKAAFEKQSNTIDAEVRSNDSLLLLNIKDMLEYRKRGCEAVNKLYGTNWSVKVSDEINYRAGEAVPAGEVANNEND